MPLFSAILLSGGKGERFNSPIPKQYHLLDGKPLALYSLETFSSMSIFQEIIVVCEKKYQSFFYKKDLKISFAQPGKRRQDSLHSGLLSLKKPCDFLIIHDIARPFITKSLINKLLKEGLQTGAATLGNKLSSTIKKTSKKNLVEKTLNRDLLWEIQTPQLIKKTFLEEGFQKIIKNNVTVTDDVSIIEYINYPVKIIENPQPNLKVTTQKDLHYASFLLLKGLINE